MCPPGHGPDFSTISFAILLLFEFLYPTGSQIWRSKTIPATITVQCRQPMCLTRISVGLYWHMACLQWDDQGGHSKKRGVLTGVRHNLTCSKIILLYHVLWKLFDSWQVMKLLALIADKNQACPLNTVFFICIACLCKIRKVRITKKNQCKKSGCRLSSGFPLHHICMC